MFDIYFDSCVCVCVRLCVALCVCVLELTYAYLHDKLNSKPYIILFYIIICMYVYIIFPPCGAGE